MNKTETVIKKPQGRSRGIDALRGTAVLMVVFFHSYVPSVGIRAYDSFLSFFHQYGTLGVDLFFVLSGFCIHGAYSKRGGEFSAKNYLSRRWWRIYPPYFFALSLAVILNLATNYFKWSHGAAVSWDNFGPLAVLSHLFLMHDFSQQTMLTISGPFWTIAMEMQYYLLYLLLRPFFYSGKGWVFLFLSSLILYFAAWHFYFIPSTAQPLNPFCYWIQWVLGAFLVYLTRIVPGFFNRKNSYFMFFIFLCSMFAYSSNMAGGPLLNRLVLSAGFFVLIAFAVSAEEVWGMGAVQWLPFVGLFSYSVYLTHFLFIDRVRTFVIMELPQGWPRFFVSTATIGASLVIAYLFYLYFEKPFHEKAVSIPK